MSNLLKSKFLLGVMVVAIMFVGVVVLNSNKADAADCSITATLRVGSRGVQVQCLQTLVGASADGVFGPMTKSAVMSWQSSMGLVADGIFGPKSRAAMSGVSMSYPAGCTSSVGFSPTTGVSCSSGGMVSTYPAGCTSSVGFSPTTGVSCSTGVATPQSGPVSVGLSTDNPASTTLVMAQATADLAHFTFSGSGTVTGVVLQRIGVSADSTPSNVYLFDGAMRLTDAASVSNNGMVTFSVPAGIFTVNGSKTIAVKSDIANTTSGQTVGMKLVSFTTANGTTTVNLSGNVHNIASASLAAVSAGSVTPSGATINPAANVTVWQSTLNVSQRDVWMKRLALRNVGSAPASAFQNFKLFVNGVQVGTAAGLDINGYVTFDLNSAPVLLVAGSRVVRVDVDVVSGASRTVQFSLRQAADVDFVDSSFLVNVAPTGTPWAPTASTISGATGGSLTIEKDITSPSTNLTLNGNDINLGTFKLTAYGEAIKLETLKAGFTYTDNSAGDNTAATLRNGRLLINGVQYGSTATLLPAGTTFTTNYTIYPGTPVLVEVHADIYDNDGLELRGILAADTIKASLVVGSQNAMRVDSLGSFNAPLSANVDANTLVVADTTITLAVNGTYSTQNTTLPATNFMIGAYNLAGSSVEDVLLTTLEVDVTAVTGTPDFGAGDITNMYAVVKNAAGTIVAQTAPLGTVSATNNNFSINYTLPKNANATIQIYGNLATDGSGTIDAGDSFRTVLTVSGTSMVSGQTVTSGNGSTTIAGQLVAYAASSITVSKDSTSPATGIVYDNQTITALEAKFVPLTSSYNVTDVTVTLPASGATVVQNVMLYDGATLVATAPGGAESVTFSGLTWNVPSTATSGKVLTVKLQLGNIGVGGGTTNASLVTTISAFTATNTSTGVSAGGAGTAESSAINAFAAVPVITKVTLENTQLLNTTARPLLRFSMVGSGGNISWNQLTFKISKDNSTTVGTNGSTGVTLWDVTSTHTAVGGTFTNAATVYGAGAGGDIGFVPSAEQVVSSTRVYELRANIAVATDPGDYVTTTLDNDSATIVASLAAGGGAGILDADSDAPIIWSDMSAASHSTATLDWTSDFGVKNLPVSDTLTSPL